VPPAPPPATTSTSTEVIPPGTVHDVVPVLVNGTIVSDVRCACVPDGGTNAAVLVVEMFLSLAIEFLYLCITYIYLDFFYF
jgi:hypothetical protein